MAQLILENIKKSYDSVDVIHGINLEIKHGEFVVFVGPSGCGKSTMLRMISGLEDVTEGRITIGDHDVTHTAPSKREIAMVFQSYALFPHMTVAENIGFGLKLAKTPREEINQRVTQVAKSLQIENLLDRTPRQLSGGQRQRVAIGRSMIRDPKIFLFDEPLSNLDAALRVQMRLEIARMHAGIDATMIYVTHDQTEAMTLADRIVVFNAGYIEQVGTPMELYSKPANTFVAGFIGAPSMNFIPATVAHKEENSEIQFGSTSISVSPLYKLDNGTSLTIGIRPEHLSVTSRNEADFIAIIEIIEELGADSLAYLKTDFIDNPVVMTIKPEEQLKRGDQVAVKVDRNHLHLFDAESGVSLRLDTCQPPTTTPLVEAEVA